MLIPYIFLFLSCLFLIIYITIRLSYGFWYYQPVFHIYDFRYYLFPCGIIEHDLPQKNRYTNFKEIETIKFDQIIKKENKHKLDNFINIIQTNYLRNKDNIFSPKEENIVPYFTGHSQSCFFSFFNKDQLLQDEKSNDFIKDKKVIGVMTTRPLNIMIKNSNNSNSNNNIHNIKNNNIGWDTFHIYYVDYLCVDIANRKKNIAPQIIQTHHYNQRHLNSKIHTSLFKREGKLTGIVPLCVYTTFGFSMKKWNQPIPLDPIFKIIKCTGHNIRFLLDFMKKTRKLFDICTSPELSNVLELIKTDNIYIYYLLDSLNENVIAAYFFKKTSTFISKGKECLSFFGSINQTEDSLFILGFKTALSTIIPKTEFYYLALENISHNGIIVNHLLDFYIKPDIDSPTAYFFYNFAYHTFRPEKTFISAF